MWATTHDLDRVALAFFRIDGTDVHVLSQTAQYVNNVTFPDAFQT
jgi:hypothetical protein